MQLGPRIRQFRKQKGLTMKQLGDKVGVHESTISGYEKGHRRPDHEMLIKIAHTLGVSLDELAGFVTEDQERISLDKLKTMIQEDKVTFDGKDLDEIQKQMLIIMIDGLLGGK